MNEAGRLRMMTYRMALDLPRGEDGGTHSYAQARQFQDSLQLLATGDPSRPLVVPWSDASRERFEAVRRHWEGLQAAWFGPPVAREALVQQAPKICSGRVE